MPPAICWMCSIGFPPTNNFRLGHERVCPSFVFPSEQLSIITPSQRSSLKVVRKKVPAFRPPLPCPHVAYLLLLWSSSSSIRRCSLVLQRNSWCSVNTLLIDLIIIHSLRRFI